MYSLPTSVTGRWAKSLFFLLVCLMLLPAPVIGEENDSKSQVTKEENVKKQDSKEQKESNRKRRSKNKAGPSTLHDKDDADPFNDRMWNHI